MRDRQPGEARAIPVQWERWTKVQIPSDARGFVTFKGRVFHRTECSHYRQAMQLLAEQGGKPEERNRSRPLRPATSSAAPV